MLIVQGNLANTYHFLGRVEEVLPIRRDVYSGRLKLNGKEHRETLLAASNWAATLLDVERLTEAKALLRKTMPVAARVPRTVNGTGHTGLTVRGTRSR